VRLPVCARCVSYWEGCLYTDIPPCEISRVYTVCILQGVWRAAIHTHPSLYDTPYIHGVYLTGRGVPPTAGPGRCRAQSARPPRSKRRALLPSRVRRPCSRPSCCRPCAVLHPRDTPRHESPIHHVKRTVIVVRVLISHLSVVGVEVVVAEADASIPDVPGCVLLAGRVLGEDSLAHQPPRSPSGAFPGTPPSL
jgi:hypothetical protein